MAAFIDMKQIDPYYSHEARDNKMIKNIAQHCGILNLTFSQQTGIDTIIGQYLEKWT